VVIISDEQVALTLVPVSFLFVVIVADDQRHEEDQEMEIQDPS
jgi:hypothetical protein